jgi:putative endonuclease
MTLLGMGGRELMGERIYYAHIVASRSLNFYVGMTGDLPVRMIQHREGRFEGHSKRFNCNRLVWFERFAFVEDAIAREKQIKGWTRAKKITLIKRENPTWIDLSEDWGKTVEFGREL